MFADGDIKPIVTVTHDCFVDTYSGTCKGRGGGDEMARGGGVGGGGGWKSL